jgi:hypothetical protein
MPAQIAEWVTDRWLFAGGQPPPIDGFPNELNTGIAQFGSMTRTPYVGFGSFDTEVEFDAYDFLAANLTNEYVRIDEGGHFTARRSYFNRRIDCDGPDRSLTLENCTVDASGGFVGVGFGDLTLKRCNISNGNNCVNVGANLLMEDCYIHTPFLPPGSADHINPLFHGGGGNITIRHSTLWAPIPDNVNGGGVSTNLSLFADFAPVYNVTIEDCLIRYTYGAYGCSLGWNPGKDFNDHPLNGTNIVFRNNTFERGPSGLCGAIGPVTSWRFGGSGNVWENNRYEDGEPVDPA